MDICICCGKAIEFEYEDYLHLYCDDCYFISIKEEGEIDDKY